MWCSWSGHHKLQESQILAITIYECQKTLLYFGFATRIYILQFKSFNFFLKTKSAKFGPFFKPFMWVKIRFSGQTAAKITRKGINDILNHHFFLLGGWHLWSVHHPKQKLTFVKWKLSTWSSDVSENKICTQNSWQF